MPSRGRSPTSSPIFSELYLQVQSNGSKLWRLKYRTNPVRRVRCCPRERHRAPSAGRILKIILYGSHARGGWVDEPHTAKGYVLDFDLLVIVNQKELTDRAA